MLLRRLAACVFVLAPGVAQGAPLFEWTEPWDVHFTGGTGTGTVNGASANFGAAATVTGQKTNLGTAGDIGTASAFARAGTSVSASISSKSSSSIGVAFERNFNLADSPGNWLVTLSGFISGILYATGPGNFHPTASVEAFAEVSGPGGFIDFTGIFTNHAYTPGGGGAPSFVLPDGNYTVTAFLQTDATVDQGLPLDYTVATSNFFSGSAGFSLTVSAVTTMQPFINPAPPPMEELTPISTDEPVEIDQGVPVAEPDTASVVAPALAAFALSRRLRSAALSSRRPATPPRSKPATG